MQRRLANRTPSRHSPNLAPGSQRRARHVGNILNHPSFCDVRATRTSRTVCDESDSSSDFRGNATLFRIFAQSWHVDCSIITTERGRRAPKLQTPIGVESARLGAFSLKVRRLSNGAYCSPEASAGYSAIESAFVTSQVAPQRGRSRNLECEQQASAPFRYGPARGHFFALCGDWRGSIDAFRAAIVLSRQPFASLQIRRARPS